MRGITSAPKDNSGGQQSIQVRAAWERPRIQKMVAGDAENAFTQAVDDGPFTRS